MTALCLLSLAAVAALAAAEVEGAPLSSVDGDESGWGFVLLQAEIEALTAELGDQLSDLALAAAASAASEGWVLSSGDDAADEAARARAVLLQQEIQAGRGRELAIALEPEEHRASVRQFQDDTESCIRMRLRDCPQWRWFNTGGVATPVWYQLERRRRDTVLTELPIFAEPSADGASVVQSFTVLPSAASGGGSGSTRQPGRSCLRGSRGSSIAARGVRWVRLAGSIASSTMGMCGLREPVDLVHRSVDPELEGVEMGVAEVEDWLGAAVQAQVSRDRKRKWVGGGDSAGLLPDSSASGEDGLPGDAVSSLDGSGPGKRGHRRNEESRKRRNASNKKRRRKSSNVE